jgi:hypothetical protein
VHLRIWFSEKARLAAIHDPDVHRYWKKLPELATITTTYEELELIFSTREGIAEDTPGSGV